jgi:hypothetical protein
VIVRELGDADTEKSPTSAIGVLANDTSSAICNFGASVAGVLDGVVA